MLPEMWLRFRTLSFMSLALSVATMAGTLQSAFATAVLEDELAGGEEVSGDGSDRDQASTCDAGRGLCTIYGDRTSLLGGRARTFVQLNEHGRPRALGLKFTSSMLSNLPYDPPFDGNNCFDINGDGDLSFHPPMPECAGGYQAILFFPAKIVKRANLPFKWFLLNWNPAGHGPIGIYDRPHFDFHFYIMDYVDRNFIRPGPCGIVVDCDDFQTAIKPVPSQFVPPDYRSFDAVEPRMGNHMVDVTSPEITGQDVFKHTFVYGAYNSKITYLEPMITLEHLQTNPNECLPVKQPAAFEVAGYYPTKYCIRNQSGAYTISLEGLKFHRGS
jgi:hypothetical protein